MKNAILLILLLLGIHRANADAIQFSKESWATLLRRAKENKRIIFIDFYATWCGPCRQLEKEVFTDEKVAKFFNSNFICKRINAEKEELELVNKMNIQSYPTLVFFDENGKVLNRIEGAPEVSEMLNYGTLASQLAELSASGSWKKNPADAKAFLEAMNSSDPAKATMLAHQYLGSLAIEDLKIADNFNILANYNKDEKSREWKYVLENLEFFKTLDGEMLPRYLMQLSNIILTKAIENKDESLLESSSRIEYCAMLLSGDSTKQHAQYAEMDHIRFLYGTGDKSSYWSETDNYVKKYYWEDKKTLTQYALFLLKDTLPNKAYQLAMEWVKQALNVDANYYGAHLILSLGYKKTGNATESSAALQEFLRCAEIDENVDRKILALLGEFD